MFTRQGFMPWETLLKMKGNIILAFIFIFVGVFILYTSMSANKSIRSLVILNKKNDTLSKEKDKDVVENLSILLNDAMKKIGRLSCELTKSEVSVNGGWCAQASGKNSTQHVTDFRLAEALSEFLAGKTVASFGDGPGVYKEKLTALNQVKVYDAFDGAPYAEETTENRVKHLDLSVPVYHLNKYDWVISLEVAEHIPAEFESIYIDNLTRHAREGIIHSWARIGQGGLSHVNNRDLDYVIEKMKLKGFEYDLKTSNHFKSKASYSWLIDNIAVYRRSKQ